MAARAYSTRFLAGNATGASQSLVIPAGKRAVVRSIVVCNFASVLDWYFIRIASAEIAYGAAVPASQMRVYDMRAVGYEGETIQIGSSAQSLSWHVDGYLFDDE